MSLRIPIMVLLAITLFCLVQPAHAAEICYSGDGGHLYLRGIPSITATKITPDDLTGGIYRIPQWIDRNRIVFIYDLNPNSEQPKTKVGILDVQAKQIKWLTSLGGSVSIGYDKTANAIIYMKIARKQPYSQTFDVYLGQYDLKTGKTKSAKSYTGGGNIQMQPIRPWIEAGSWIVPVGTSDVSDQVAVYSTAKKKFLSPKYLSDSWKQSNLNSWAVPSMSAGPKNVLAISAISSENGQMGTTLYSVLTANDAVSKIRKSDGFILNASYSADGKWLAWCELNLQDSSKSVWFSRVGELMPIRLCKGSDPAWRP